MFREPGPPDSACQPPVSSMRPGPADAASSASDCVSTIASIHAPLAAGTTRTTTR